MTWQAAYAQRYNARVGIRRPAPAAPYTRLSDAEIADLPSEHRGLALAARSINDSMAAIVRSVNRPVGDILMGRP